MKEVIINIALGTIFSGVGTSVFVLGIYFLRAAFTIKF